MAKRKAETVTEAAEPVEVVEMAEPIEMPVAAEPVAEVEQAKSKGQLAREHFEKEKADYEKRTGEKVWFQPPVEEDE